MFNARSKIIKKDEDTSELEEEVAKILYDYEMQVKDDSLKKQLVNIHIAAVEDFTVTERNEEQSKCLLVRIPYRSLLAFRRIRHFLISHLERKMNCTVLVVAVRKILSRSAKGGDAHKRPRSRTLTAVHEALLEDIALPANIVGRQIRVHTDGSKSTKVFLDPLDKDKVEDRLDAMSEAYRRVTNKRVKFLFAKPTTFQKALAEFKKKQKGQ